MSSSHKAWWPQNIEWHTHPNIIQHEFNSRQLYERLQNNELKATILKSRHRASKDEPKCTSSQVLIYWDSRSNAVAMVHQYLRPDGTIGGSGKPDPKWIVVEDKVMVLRAKSKHSARARSRIHCFGHYQFKLHQFTNKLKAKLLRCYRP